MNGCHVKQLSLKFGILTIVILLMKGRIMKRNTIHSLLMVFMLSGVSSTLYSITPINDVATFDAIIQHNDYVIVDFWMPRCAPCVGIAAKLESIAQQLPMVQLYKVDITSAEAVARRFNIRSVPHVVLFKNGRHVGSHLGNSITTPELANKIKKVFELP